MVFNLSPRDCSPGHAGPLLSLKKVLKLPPPAPSCRTSHSAPFPHPRTGRASWSCAVSSRPLAGKSHVLGTSLCSPASAAREAAAARGEPWSACCLVKQPFQETKHTYHLPSSRTLISSWADIPAPPTPLPAFTPVCGKPGCIRSDIRMGYPTPSLKRRELERMK